MSLTLLPTMDFLSRPREVAPPTFSLSLPHTLAPRRLASDQRHFWEKSHMYVSACRLRLSVRVVPRIGHCCYPPPPLLPPKLSSPTFLSMMAYLHACSFTELGQQNFSPKHLPIRKKQWGFLATQ